MFTPISISFSFQTFFFSVKCFIKTEIYACFALNTFMNAASASAPSMGIAL